MRNDKNESELEKEQRTEIKQKHIIPQFSKNMVNNILKLLNASIRPSIYPFYSLIRKIVFFDVSVIIGHLVFSG